MEYNKIIYEQNKEPDSLNLNDVNIWTSIFNKLYPILKYYQQIYEPSEQKYRQNQLANVYVQQTFQEFVDNQININSIGSYDYQIFTKSMENKTFKNNIILKYEKDCHLKTLKNHIIYLASLYLIKESGQSKYFTEEELNDIELTINIIPYFEYLNKLGYTLEDIHIDMNIEYNDTTLVSDVAFNILENKILYMIKDKLL